MQFDPGALAPADTMSLETIKKRISMAFAFVTLSMAATVAHADEFVVQPVQMAYEDVRYQQGNPTIDIRMTHGAVEIRPLPLDHGSLAFSVAILNAANAPVTIDSGNFYIKAGNQVISPFTVDQLRSKAKNRAVWSKVGTAVGGYLAASIVGSALADTSYGTVATPQGTYTVSMSTPSLAGEIASARIMDNTITGIAAIQDRLDNTRAQLGNEIVQTSTIDPGRTYAGKLVFQKLKVSSLPQHITLVVGLNGEQYAFAFQLAKPGTPAPPIAYSAPAPPTPVAAPVPAAYVAANSQTAPASNQTLGTHGATVQLATAAAPANPKPRPSHSASLVSVSSTTAYQPQQPARAKRDDWGLVAVPSQVGY
jgi:hypothetical protein